MAKQIFQNAALYCIGTLSGEKIYWDWDSDELCSLEKITHFATRANNGPVRVHFVVPTGYFIRCN